MEKILDEKDDKAFEKTVGSIVYFNHFHALRLHIESFKDRHDLEAVKFFNRLKCHNPSFDVNESKRFFLNSWATERALLFPRQFKGEDFHKYSLQWSFPQAYYSVYLNLAAFRATQDRSGGTHGKAMKAFGAAVRDGQYPTAIRFHASGLFNELKIHHLPERSKLKKDFNSLEEIKDTKDAQSQIASFLSATRKINAWEKREKRQASNKSALRKSNGEILKVFRKKHWDVIYQEMPTTSLMNLLYRMRLKANYHDIETFLNADIDFECFYENLIFIVDYLNFLHEAYFAKAVGKSAYEGVLRSAPKKIIEHTALKRYELIKDNPG